MRGFTDRFNRQVRRLALDKRPMRRFGRWLRCLATLTPHEVIGPADDPYLRRWYLLPHNRYFNIFIHHFVRGDTDRHLHDHPRDSISLLFRGKYNELRDVTPGAWERDGQVPAQLTYSAPALIWRRAEDSHAIMSSENAWTLFIFLRRRRDWGFWTQYGWVPWRDYCSATCNRDLMLAAYSTKDWVEPN